jgi:DNA-binding transcriptional MerR regulator
VAVGLSVRALHHYDAVGVVVPRERTGAGHRLYDRHDVARLERVAAMRRCGLGLRDIADALADGDVLAALERRLAEVDQEMAKTRDLRARLSRAIEEMKMIDEKLARRAELVGEKRIREVEAEWAGLFTDMEALRVAGVAAGDPRAQALAAKGDALFAELHGGDADLRAHATAAVSEQAPEEASRGMVSAELWAYYTAAQAVRARRS